MQSRHPVPAVRKSCSKTATSPKHQKQICFWDLLRLKAEVERQCSHGTKHPLCASLAPRFPASAAAAIVAADAFPNRILSSGQEMKALGKFILGVHGVSRPPPMILHGEILDRGAEVTDS